MRAVKHIDSEKIIAIDIETVRLQPLFHDLDEETQESWLYTNKDKIMFEIPTTEEAVVLWEKRASLFAEFSKVCAVSLTYMNKGELRCKSITSYSEEAILRELTTVLNTFHERGGYRLLGHAIKYFDAPFLCKRYIINSMEPPLLLDESGLKPWEREMLDTNELWGGFGTGLGSNLMTLCNTLKVETSKGDLTGQDVGKAYYNGELERIAQYCNLDAIATYNVLRRFKLEPVIPQEDVIYTNKGEIIEPIPFLQAISNTRNITAAQEKELSTYVSKLPEGDKEMVRRILRAAVIDDEGKVKIPLEKKIKGL
jgi:hypothetical protein